MKTHFKRLHDKLNPWNLFIGIAIGFGVGLYAYSFMLPTMNQHAFRVLKLDRASGGAMGNVTFVRGEPVTVRAMDMHAMGFAAAGVASAIITPASAMATDKQFVEHMIRHHEEAVRMAQHVLTLNPREDIKLFANEVISAQSDEIRTMKGWLEKWEQN